MYTRCIFCTRDLGANEVVEHFPVGRRLAFDPEKGRLWVVCPRCERWNLSPFEERWEALEECERLFRDARMRYSTENIGIARHPEGLELVRIGRPLRPEFAAWRYGDQFGRRRKKTIAVSGLGAVAAGLVVTGSTAAGGGLALAGIVAYQAFIVGIATYASPWLRLRTPDGERKLISPDVVNTARINPVDDDLGWMIRIGEGAKEMRFHGAEALEVAGKVLPRVNRGGGRKGTVQDAVELIEEVGDSAPLIRRVTGSVPAWKWLTYYPREQKLALEMALHEEQERRALEGELEKLEAAWREAEEIAAISDDLLLPDGVRAFIRRHRPGGPPG